MKDCNTSFIIYSVAIGALIGAVVLSAFSVLVWLQTVFPGIVG